MSYRYSSALVLALLALSSMGIGEAAAAPSRPYRPAPGHHVRSNHTRARHPFKATSWQEHDRAVYVVSTLNGPLCPSGQQLSTVLWQKDGARLFDVLKSKTDKNLYYVQVRKASKNLIGVYAYTFGWKMPAAVKNGKCVVDAVSPSVLDPYRYRQFIRIARFKTTFPQS
jgi:hypothetical protein